MTGPLDPAVVDEVVRRALAEDFGDAGDITTDALISADAHARGALVTREDCVVAGLPVFAAVFASLDAGVKVAAVVDDGGGARPGDVVAEVEGPARAILAGERTALNFLQRLSGIATLTRRFVDRAPGVELRDTRKTTPGLRALEKYAVRIGGGTNHRMGLFDRVLIKDNHVVASGGIRRALERVRASRPGVPVEVECETLEHVREAVEAGADEVLFDNMDPKTLRDAVRLVAGRARTEASGGVTLESVADIAATGVDAVSVGSLTHSAPAIDFSLELEA